jgi:hypothetical protein
MYAHRMILIDQLLAVSNFKHLVPFPLTVDPVNVPFYNQAKDSSAVVRCSFAEMLLA